MNYLQSLQLEINPIDAINRYNEYYSSYPDNAFMDVISTLIEDIAYPVFVVKNGRRNLYAVNSAGMQGIDPLQIDSITIDDILLINDSVLEAHPTVFFNNQWYLLHTDSFEAGGEIYEKIELTHHTALPDTLTLDRWKHMIAVMLHRFRSPITGIAGYLELLIQENENDRIQHRTKKIDEGVTHIANIMDELEYFYHIPTKYNPSKFESVDLNVILNRVQFDLPEDDRNRIQYIKLMDTTPYVAIPDSLEKVILLLVKNALTYSPDHSPVIVSHLSNNCIKITNEGHPISDEIKDHIFHPFVTSRANNLGIGLTMALIFASQFGGSIFLTENGQDGRISFSICFPPTKKITDIQNHDVQ